MLLKTGPQRRGHIRPERPERRGNWGKGKGNRGSGASGGKVGRERGEPISETEIRGSYERYHGGLRSFDVNF
jgi:hypothetical protein